MKLLNLRRKRAAALLLSACGMAIHGPGIAKAPKDGAVMIQATETAELPKPVEIITIPQPLPLPGQLKSWPASDNANVHPTKVIKQDPAARISAANAAARVQPFRDGFLNAIQQYPFTEGALYQVYTALGQVTDIALQEGEQLVGSGPVAAGDTVRWIIGDTTAGTGAQTRVHILVKPTRANLSTNLVINTDRRTYHIELRSTASTYMASLSWSYPQDDLIALRGRNAQAQAAMPVAGGINVAALNFGYTMKGDKPSWRPLRVFDDGGQVFIEFPDTIDRDELPPLFVLGASGKAELVNYRFKDRFMIMDRLFDAAELRLGDRHSSQVVKIVRRSVRQDRDARP